MRAPGHPVAPRPDPRRPATPSGTSAERRAAIVAEELLGLGFYPDELGLPGVPVIAPGGPRP